MLPERSALSCFSFTAQFQVPAYSLTFSAYELPRNVPPFTGTFPHLAPLLLSQLSARTRQAKDDAIDLALSHGRPGFEPRGGVPHRKERGHSNSRYHDWRSWSHPTRRSERRRTLSS